MLLCSFASSRSRPEKIRHWIEYLELNRERYRDQPEAIEMIDLLLARAYGWIASRAAR